MDLASLLATKGDTAITIRPEQSIRDALGLLARHDVGALVAVDETGLPVGILSERDIVREAASNEACFDRRVADLMTRDIVSLRAHDDLTTVADTMTRKRIRHLLVVHQSRLVGLVSVGDVLMAERARARGETDTLQAMILSTEAGRRR